MLKVRFFDALEDFCGEIASSSMGHADGLKSRNEAKWRAMRWARMGEERFLQSNFYAFFKICICKTHRAGAISLRMCAFMSLGSLSTY